MSDRSDKSDGSDLHAFLSDGLDRPLALTLTRNRCSLIRLRALPNGHLDLRVHRCLLEAPPDILRLLKRFLISHRRSDWKAVCAWLRNVPRDRAPMRDARLRAGGTVYDLQAILDQVNATWFPGPCSTRITWGQSRPPRHRKRRHIAYGSYHREPDVIRIHPLLDDARAPRDFVTFIVYHERLHAILGAACRSGRQCHHTREFRLKEQQYPDFDRMKELSRTLFQTLDKPKRTLFHDILFA